MEDFRKPSTQVNRRAGSAIRDAIAVAVAIPATVYAASLLERHLGLVSGDFVIAAVAGGSVMFYWNLSQKQFDEIGQRLFLESAAFCLSCVIAAAVGIAVLWKNTPVLREVIATYGFTIFFSAAAVAQVFGYWRARRKLQ